MPTYEYKCTECEERFEIEQPISEDALTTLDGDDHEHKLKKVFSPIGIAFRGSGFYKNDARGSSSSSASKSSTASTSTTTDSSSSSSSSDSSSSSSTAAAPAAPSAPATPKSSD